MKHHLKIEPVRRYPTPAYPTRQAVNLDPALLTALPIRWRRQPAVCAALILTLSTGLAGCAPMRAAHIDGNLAIPIFEHGDGRGVYGCVSVAPPVFLSEEEALQVIREEANARGIDFSGSYSITGDDFPATSLDPGLSIGPTPEPDKLDELGNWEGTLALDGYDEKIGLGFEFVSQQDVVDWSGGHGGGILDAYDMKGTASRLSEVLDNVAVFYDPGADFEDVEITRDMEAYTDQQKKIMTEKLREQVRDFLAWLAAQGVI